MLNDGLSVKIILKTVLKKKHFKSKLRINLGVIFSVTLHGLYLKVHLQVEIKKYTNRICEMT